jgi:hypothetical protein
MKSIPSPQKSGPSKTFARGIKLKKRVPQQWKHDSNRDQALSRRVIALAAGRGAIAVVAAGRRAVAVVAAGRGAAVAIVAAGRGAARGPAA